MNSTPTNLPEPTRLLGDILRMAPDTRDGQYNSSAHTLDLVESGKLGSPEIIEFPVKQVDGTEVDYPLLKIMIDATGTKRRTEEVMTWLGHSDTVKRSAKQMSRDALELEEVKKGRTKGKGRGAGDMIGGNLAYLYAAEMLRDSGNIPRPIQILLPAREEASSEVLWQAIKQGHVEKSPIGMTTEITTKEVAGEKANFYHARTGRIGLNIRFMGEEGHAGVELPNEVTADYKHLITKQALLYSNQPLVIDNSYPGDNKGILPQQSKLKTNVMEGVPEGLSVAGAADQSFNFLYNDPSLAPEVVHQKVVTFIEEKTGLRHGKDGDFYVQLEKRNVDNIPPFTDPYLTPPDLSLVTNGYKIAKEVRGSKPLKKEAAGGVAEDGMLFHQLKMMMIGWAPKNYGAHTDKEYVIMECIRRRALWLMKTAQFDGSLIS